MNIISKRLKTSVATAVILAMSAASGLARQNHEQIDAQATDGSAIFCALHDLALLERFDRAILISDGNILADGPAREIAASETLAESFRVEPLSGGDWRIRRPADP